MSAGEFSELQGDVSVAESAVNLTFAQHQTACQADPRVQSGVVSLTECIGADIFRFAEGSDLDLVTAFNAGEGDRVVLDPEVEYEVAQDGADTVITLADGARMVLAGVQLDALPQGWIAAA